MSNLREYATPKQLEYLQAIDAHGSERKAAEALGVSKSTVRSAVERVARKATQQADAPGLWADASSTRWVETEESFNLLR